MSLLGKIQQLMFATVSFLLKNIVIQLFILPQVLPNKLMKQINSLL